MILAAHDLWSHIAGSTTSVSVIVWFDNTGNTQVCGTQVALVIKDQILRFDVAVDNIIEMEILKSNQNASDKKLSLHLLETPAAAHVVAEVATDKQVHNEVKVLTILEGVGHIDDEWMLELRKQLSLVEN
jgi:hypothetical protein